MKTIDLFYILSICCFINCTEEGWQVYSIEYVDTDDWKENFNYQNKDSEKYLFGIKELNMLVEKIQNVCVLIKTVKNGAPEYTLDEEIYNIAMKIINNSCESLEHFESDELFEGLDTFICKINQLSVIIEKKQDGKHEIPLFKIIKNVIFYLQDLNALSQVVEKLFTNEKGKSQASNYSYEMREELSNLHSSIKKICDLNQEFLTLSDIMSHIFNEKKENVLSKIMNNVQYLKSMEHYKYEEDIISRAKDSHGNIINFFLKYLSYLENKKRILASIIIEFEKVCCLKKNIDIFLKLIEENRNEN